MAQSSAKMIAYDLRPAKQTERKILIDFLKIAGDCGYPINTYRYIGMGGNRFYDFLMMHRYLGLNSMISLEYDEDMYERARFNCPYGFIDVKNLSTSEFINHDDFVESSIIWFDYDGAIGPHIVADIASLSTKLKQGDFCFVTVSCHLAGELGKKKDHERLEQLQETMPDVTGELTLEDMQNADFHNAVFKIIKAAFKNAFSIRQDERFIPFVQIQYADGAKMVTIGGGLLPKDKERTMKRRVKQSLPFLLKNPDDLYKLKSLNLTERERVLFDIATTTPKKRTEKLKLKSLGFSELEINTYKELIRYIPRYVESII